MFFKTIFHLFAIFLFERKTFASYHNTSCEFKSSFEAALNKLQIPAHSYTFDLWPDLLTTKNLMLGDLRQDTINRCYDPIINAEQEKTINIFENKIIDIVHHYFLENNNLVDSSNLVKRTQILVNNVRTLIELIQNCQTKPPEDQSQYGLTSMSSLSDQEYLMILNNFTEVSFEVSFNSSKCNYSTDIFKMPKDVDWRTKGVVTPVKNQGSCGSCYIFSAIATVESHYMINKKKSLPPLSEQEWVNCVSRGCNGGFATLVYDAIMKNQGATEEKNIPYIGKQQKCKHGPLSPVKVSGYCYEHGNWHSDKHLESLLYNYGPITVAVDASSNDWKHSKGELKGYCGKHLNHAVTMVGYNQQFWIIKNSWGTKAGNQGYFMLPKGENKCGINTVVGLPYIE